MSVALGLVVAVDRQDIVARPQCGKRNIWLDFRFAAKGVRQAWLDALTYLPD